MLKVKIYDNDNDQNSEFFKDAGRSWLAFCFGKTKLHRVKQNQQQRKKDIKFHHHTTKLYEKYPTFHNIIIIIIVIRNSKY